MKKIALAFLLITTTFPVFGGIYYDSGWRDVIDKYVPIENRDSVGDTLREIYDEYLGIKYDDLWKLCAAAGWDVKTSQGDKQCKDFVHDLIYSGEGNLWSQPMAVCNDSTAVDVRQHGGTAICVRDFSNEYIGGTQVRLSEAILLAQLYAEEKYKDEIACATKPRSIPVLGSFDYGIKCVSVNSHKYYEFIFDDVTESDDATIQDDIQRAVCKGIYGAKSTSGEMKNYNRGGGNMGSVDTIYVRPSCDADVNLCNSIDKALNGFGYSASFSADTSGGPARCFIDFHTVTAKDALRTAYGIDNFEFCKDIQVQNTSDVTSMLKAFVSQKSGKPVSQIGCYAGTNKYTGGGCSSKTGNMSDDIKTCYVDGNFIDFVFDDLSEFSKTYINGGLQGMSCIVAGGTYSGQRCLGLGEAQCDVLKKANIKSCPECANVRWDSQTKSCVLPSSQAAHNLEKGITISLIIGGTVVGVVITVATAGTVGVPMAAFVLTGIETLGAGLEITSQLKIDAIADDFLVKSNQCENFSCAQQLIGQHLQRLANLQNDFSDSEIRAIDSEMARLANLIPDKSDFWVDVALNGLNLSDNKIDFWKSWEPEQVARAVGVALQLASIVTATARWLGVHGAKMIQFRDVAKGKVSRTMSWVQDASEKGLSPKHAELRRKMDSAKSPKAPKSTLNGWGAVDNFEIVKNNLDSNGVGVFKFKTNGKVYYLKATDEFEELRRTKRAYEILGDNNGIVSSVKVVNEDQALLSDIAKQNGIEVPQGYTWFLTEETKAQKGFYQLIMDFKFSGANPLLDILQNKPITLAEQKEILSAIKKLNNNGIYHGDLASNLFVIRDKSGKLHVSIIDYEPWSVSRGNSDIEVVNDMFKEFRELGWAE